MEKRELALLKMMLLWHAFCVLFVDVLQNVLMHFVCGCIAKCTYDQHDLGSKPTGGILFCP